MDMLIEELFDNHSGMIVDDKIVGKFIYYISNKYPFISYKELDFILINKGNNKLEIKMNNDYTRFVLTDDKIIVLRKHIINNLLKRDIIKEFE